MKAQKLIFGFTTEGDFTPFFSGYFDTRIGGKKETVSYRNILSELGVEACTVLFLSDVEAELEAAEETGAVARCQGDCDIGKSSHGTGDIHYPYDKHCGVCLKAGMRFRPRWPPPPRLSADAPPNRSSPIRRGSPPAWRAP